MDHLVFVEDLFAVERIKGEERKTYVLSTSSLHSPEHERIHNPVSFLSCEARIHILSLAIMVISTKWLVCCLCSPHAPLPYCDLFS